MPRTTGDRIPADNVRVPHEEFVAVWRAAQDRGVDDGYAAAVAHTCRWLAAVPMRTALCGGQTRSPVTQRACTARPDTIEAEWAAAQEPADGWSAGARATLRWAWRGEGPPPLEA